jgi:ribosomal protein S18 acetylase RimI-like enzyme
MKSNSNAMQTIQEIIIKSGKQELIAELASMVATAMLNNPLHMAVFQSNDENSRLIQTRLFVEVLRIPTCNLMVAKQNGKVVGVMNYYLPGQCQISPLKTITLLPRLLLVLGPKLHRVLRWKSNWIKHDPNIPHLHFGPLAVLPHMQGRGIGSELLNHFCRIADIQGANAYLETDKEENVKLYERHGFKVVETDTLFKVMNWFMWRDTAQV